MGTVQGMTLLGGLSLMLFAASLEMADSPGSMPDRVGKLGLFMLLPLPLLVGIAVASVREPERRPAPSAPWQESVRSLSARSSLRRLVAADLLVGIQMGTTSSLHVFFVSQALVMPDSASAYLVISMVSGLVGIPLWVALSRLVGKHRALCAAAALGSAAAVVTAALPQGNFAAGAVAFATLGLYFGSRELLMRSMMADAVLEDSAMNAMPEGADRAGTFFAMLTFTAKLGIAAAVGITFVLLEAIGFSGDAPNGPDVLSRFRWIMGGLPLVTGWA